MRLSLLLSLFAVGSLSAQGFTPEEAIKRMQLPEGFTAKAVATEPMIRQPLSVSFDEKGRMWVLQYLQYPNPAGLKAIKQDQYLRTVWDRVPEPPPKGPKGLDRITICYEPDAEGRFTKSKDFVSGLNLATGFCIGGGGVYVVQPPYLLFYPDKDHDDVPDGDPEVCLAGFGMEDSHSYANSLQWGPDGWLYGAHGSTVTAKIKNPANPKEVLEFQQGIWRYHPKTKQFELFAEGGGNTYGLDFDKHGQCIAGTNFGGAAMLHHVQGAYYVKGFSKHGPLHNPHTYGYFDHVPYKNFKGGHVTCGGIVYQADAYPKEFHDQYIAGNLLSNAIYWHKMTPKGSTFTAEHGGDLIVSNDSWFRPVDCFLGPDGSVYVADWYDKRAAHLDPVDNWDKTNGRIYRIEYKGTKQPESFDLRKKTSAELVELLKHPNKWWRNEARRLLAERQDKSVVATLKKQALEEKGLLALESLWAFYQVEGLKDELVLALLKHPNEHVRAWSVRLIGDRKSSFKIDLEVALSDLAKSEKNLTVLAQLACTAKYVGFNDKFNKGLFLTSDLMDRDDLASDPFLPLLIWWAVEAHFDGFKETHYFYAQQATKHPFRLSIVERYARKGAATNWDKLWSLLQSTNDVPEGMSLADVNHAIMTGIDAGLLSKPEEYMRMKLINSLKHLDPESMKDPLRIRLLVRLGDADAHALILKSVADPKIPDAEMVKLIQLLGQVRRPESLPVLMGLFRESKSEAIRGAALTAAQSFGDPKVIEELAAAFPKLTGGLRQQVLGILLSRPATTLTVLRDVDAKKLDPKSIPNEQLRPVLEFKNEEIDKLVIKHWGKIGGATPGEKQARITWLGAELNRGAGYAASGKTLFTKHCAACHTLFGEGGKVGPDLTTADRKNRGYLLTHIVDPSLYVRPEFMSYNVTTLDNRRLSGLVTDATEASVTLNNYIENKVVKTIISKKDIEEMLPSATSLMPEKMLDTLSYQDIRDLFAYLQTQVVDGPKEKSPPGMLLKKDDSKKLKVLLISGSVEYKSDETLPILQKYLEANYPVECVRAFRKTDDDLPGLEALDTCDVAVFFTRRLTIKGEQLERIKKYAASGKPIVAIRTASHGFQNWLDMDKDILGGNYKGHFGAGPKCECKLTDAGAKHPTMNGVKPFISEGSLYKNQGHNKDVTVLMTGEITKEKEPITWVRENKGGRVFYTSLGHPKDFEEDSFKRMIANALYWTAKKEIPAK